MAALWGRFVPLVPGFREVDFTTDKAEYSLGRHKACDIVVADRHVSSNHCVVKHEAGTVFIVDNRYSGQPVWLPCWLALFVSVCVCVHGCVWVTVWLQYTCVPVRGELIRVGACVQTSRVCMWCPYRGPHQARPQLVLSLVAGRAGLRVRPPAWTRGVRAHTVHEDI
jgi:hypothetical protein